MKIPYTIRKKPGQSATCKPSTRPPFFMRLSIAETIAALLDVSRNGSQFTLLLVSHLSSLIFMACGSFLHFLIHMEKSEI
jgi:hypothetical protein